MKAKAAPESEEGICVLVARIGDDDVQLKVSKDAPLGELFDAACVAFGQERSRSRLLFEGVRVALDDTARMIGLEDGDKVDFATVQVGGGKKKKPGRKWVAKRRPWGVSCWLCGGRHEAKVCPRRDTP